jgi:aspartate kinase
LSTCIISHYLDEAGVSCQWLDVRDLIRTDNNFRDAGIDWEETAEKIKTAIAPTGTIYITQGFIGSTDDNESTTLGREGSDYSAAVFANILEAESLTIWKDVEGVMNADPKEFPEAELIAELNFNEVIEMAFYGAQVIHPKTIKPLQNKGIPLLVKCFLDPSLPGTIIHKKTLRNLPPIIVIKRNQALLHLKSRDFSFVGDEPMSRLYQLFGKLKIKPTLIQTGAISVQVCMDDHTEKIAHFASDSADLFDLQVEKNLNILTIRHFNETVLGKYAEGKNIVLSQRTRETIQIIYA